MQLICLREIPENIADEWNALVLQRDSPEVFYTYEWAAAVSRAYRDSLTPLLFLAHDEGRLIGLAALATDLLQRQVFFLSATTADYCDFVSPANRRTELVSLVLGELDRLRLPMLELANLPADSATVHAIGSLGSKIGPSSFSRPAYECLQIGLESAAQHEAAKLALSAQKTLRYSLRNLEKKGVDVEHLTSWDDIQAALPSFIEAHISRFRLLGRISHLSHPARQQFLRELAFLLSAKRQMVLTRLLISGQPIAWNYGFRFQGSWFYYQPTFVGEWQRFSPGVCLLAKIVEAACDEPAINRVDLGLGAEEYKRRFATRTRQTLHVTVTRSARRRLRVAACYHVALAIKSSPHLEHWLRRLLRRPGDVAA